jgi:hypothetical protein
MKIIHPRAFNSKIVVISHELLIVGRTWHLERADGGQNKSAASAMRANIKKREFGESASGAFAG